MRPTPVNFLERETEAIPQPKTRILFFIGLLVFVLLGIGGCIRLVTKPISQTDPTQYDPITLEPKHPSGFIGKIKQYVFGTEPELEGEKKDRINMLLLGQGGLGHDGPFLTDTIILLSVKPSTKQIGFVSIPRDMSISIPGVGIRKINYANAHAEAKEPGSGPIFTKKIIEDTFDIDIHYYARVDFKAFEEIIDEVNGVRIDVERSFVDKEYPAPNDLYQTVSFQKGVQNMDGETALTFARSRHGNNGEGSDFARSKRQQKILLALKEKVLSFTTLSNPVKINGILTSLQNHVVTNMTLPDVITFLRMGKDLNTEQIHTLTLDTAIDGYLKNGYSPDGAFILEPVTGNFDAIGQAIEHIFEQTTEVAKVPEQTAPKENATSLAALEEPKEQEKEEAPATIEIQNATWQAGKAARVKQEVETKGFFVGSIGNTQTRPIATSGIYILKPDGFQKQAEELSLALDIPLKQTIPQGEGATSTTHILVILGEDFQE